MSPYILCTLLASIGLGTTITVTSSHWLLAWMGLEIGTLAMVPLMARSHQPRAVEAAVKYFIAQATAAATLLLAAATNAWFTGEWDICQASNPVSAALAVASLAFKLGMAPLHLWLPEVLQGLDLPTGWVLSTWQKIAPFVLLTQLQASCSTPVVIALGVTSILVGGWGGLNQTQLRKVIAYSSIAHLGWMVLVVQFSPNLSLFALMIYIVLTSSLFLALTLNAVTDMNSLAISWYKAPGLTAVTPLILLSLGGLPPLTGFGPKWMILLELSRQGLLAVATLVAISSLLSLYFYLRVSYNAALTMPPNSLPSTSPPRFQTQQKSFPLALSTIMSLGLLPLMPALTVLLLQ
uniref:NADH-ubiquinone oxidoreductase chain 2 n=1 Tax=Bothus myriaster TaxID=366894 RepID=A0A3G0Z5R1_BOTMY|nr:NADH dehydrogenase subunit 2 [Bothus myriaster]AID59798.1 NADH dehydrogenase subunit 2 [Bothus myriaster]